MREALEIPAAPRARATGRRRSMRCSRRPRRAHFPVPIAVVHGVLAVTTVGLVFLAAAGVGD